MRLLRELRKGPQLREVPRMLFRQRLDLRRVFRELRDFPVWGFGLVGFQLGFFLPLFQLGFRLGFRLGFFLRLFFRLGFRLFFRLGFFLRFFRLPFFDRLRPQLRPRRRPPRRDEEDRPPRKQRMAFKRIRLDGDRDHCQGSDQR